jgi:hypothetical protein
MPKIKNIQTLTDKKRQKREIKNINIYVNICGWCGCISSTV